MKACGELLVKRLGAQQAIAGHEVAMIGLARSHLKMKVLHRGGPRGRSAFACAAPGCA